MKSILIIFVSMSALAFKLAISSAPNDLSPFFSTDANSQNINRLVHLSLIDFDQKMNIICRLCESYEEKRKGDDYSVIFTIRKDIKFWDGSNLELRDVENSIKYFTEENKIKSIFRFAFSNIIEVKRLGENKIELKYNKFGLDHLPNLVLLKIIKIPEYNNIKKVENSDLVGAGDYKYGEVDSSHIYLIPTRPSLSGLDFIVVKDETTLSLKMIKGEIDISLAEMSPRKINYLENNSNVNVIKSESTNYNYIGLNHRKKYFKDLRIRKALSLLVPREKIVKYKFKENAIVANSMFSRAFENLFIDRKEEYNPEMASKLLQEAGLIKKDGTWYFEGKPFRLLWKSTNNKFALELVEIIRDEFNKSGIEIELVVQEWGTFLRGLKSGEYDLFVGRWIGFTGADMLKFAFHTENFAPKGANRGFYSNPELDMLLDKAETTEDRKKRDKIYKDANMLVNNDYAYINLWHPSMIWVMKDCISIEGMYPNGNMLALKNIKDNCGKR